MHKCIGSIAVLLAATASAAGEDETLCQTADLIIRGETPEVRHRICEIAAREIPRLAACNVLVPKGITVRLEDTLPEDCVGMFHCGEALISLLPPDIMAKRRASDSAFADVSDTAYFDSVLVHELTHAAYDSVQCPFSDCLATTEYAAYTMQVRSLPPEARETFEARSALDHRVSWDELSPIYYSFAPNRFAQKAWRHFTQRDDGCEFIRGIMDGNVFFDREHL